MNLSSRPNFLVFMPDQLRADCVGCFGNGVVKTPNIDALARRGVRFDQAYVNHPVCSPSRVNLMTGWYPHTRGHRTLTHLIKPWEPNLLRYLKDGGYHVAWAGARGDMFAPGVTEASTHFSGWLTRPDRLRMDAPFPVGHQYYQAHYHGRRPGGTWLDFDEAAVRTAEAWLRDPPAGPWMLFVPLIFPHVPFEVEEPWYSMHRPEDMPEPLPPRDGKPAFHAALRDAYGTGRLTATDWAEIARTYYGMIARVDAQLGRLAGALEETGEAEATSIWFFTDHGEYLGDFGLVEKWPSGLDVCLTRNPLIVTLPDGAGGRTAGTFAEMVDIPATILDLAEVEARHSHFGRSLRPVLAEPDTVVRDAAFCEGGFSTADVHLFENPTGEYLAKGQLQRESPSLVGKAVAVRTADYTYVHRLYERDELYVRADDPREQHNRIDDADLQDVARDLERRVTDWLLETSDVIPWDADPRFPRVERTPPES